MAKPNLKLVEPVAAPPPPEKRIILDDIFFHKTQLKIGTRLAYYGRSDAMSEWQIVGITSHFLSKKVGQYRMKPVDEIRHLSDIIELQKVGSNSTRKMNFSYMSYSAIWRLAQ